MPGAKRLSFWRYTRVVWRRALNNFRSRAVSVLLSLAIAVAILLLQVRFGVIPQQGADIRWKALILPYIGCFAVLVIGYLWHASWQIHSEEVQKLDDSEDKIKTLKTDLQRERENLTGCPQIVLQYESITRGPRSAGFYVINSGVDARKVQMNRAESKNYVLTANTIPYIASGGKCQLQLRAESKSNNNNAFTDNTAWIVFAKRPSRCRISEWQRYP